MTGFTAITPITEIKQRRTKYKMKIYKPICLNERGKRGNQEDSIYPLPGEATVNNRTFLVCDGMGGHEAGEVASSTVCETLPAYLKAHDSEPFGPDLLRDALTAAYEALIAKDHSRSEKKMGTTLTLLHLSDTMAYVAHIGDSRVYHLRPTGAGGVYKIIHRTQDHSLVNELVRAGVITEAEAENHPRKNVITRAMQPRDDRRDGATFYRTNDVQPDDIFFLCSDGVSGAMTEEMLCSLCTDSNFTDEERMKMIAEQCAEHSNDNYSAYLIHIEEGIANDGVIVSDVQEVRMPQAPAEIPDAAAAPAVSVAPAPAPMPMPAPTIDKYSTAATTEVPKGKVMMNRTTLISIAVIVVIALLAAVYFIGFSNGEKKGNDENDGREKTEQTDKQNPDADKQHENVQNPAGNPEQKEGTIEVAPIKEEPVRKPGESDDHFKQRMEIFLKAEKAKAEQASKPGSEAREQVTEIVNNAEQMSEDHSDSDD